MIDIKNLNPEKWEDAVVEVVPEHPKNNLQSASIINFKLTCFYMENVSDRIKVYDLNQQPAKMLHEIKLPEIGSIGKTVAHYNETEFFFRHSSFTDPGTLY